MKTSRLGKPSTTLSALHYLVPPGLQPRDVLTSHACATETVRKGVASKMKAFPNVGKLCVALVADVIQFNTPPQPC